MCEWLKQAVLKTAVPERVSGVRIPLPPPSFLQGSLDSLRSPGISPAGSNARKAAQVRSTGCAHSDTIQPLEAMSVASIGRPQSTEAAPHYFTYIDQVAGDDVVAILESQLKESLRFLSGISEEKSLYRYAPDKWSIRQLLNHVADTERAFAFRALWFARGFDSALPSYDQTIAASGAEADRVSWAAHIEEFRCVRLSTIPLFRNMPPDAWMTSGIASEKRFTVRALAYIIAGHVAHHLTVLRERYLPARVESA